MMTRSRALRIGMAGTLAVVAAAGTAMFGARLDADDRVSTGGKSSFTLFIRETAEDFALRDDKGPKGRAYWEAWGRYHGEMIEKGVFKGGMALPAAKETRSIGPVEGRVGVIDGPANAESMPISGYFIIEVEGWDEALAWARKAPNATTGRVEVRKEYPAPGMPAR
ncbi:MAG: YciI family protein [Isosphaeraceae bacterium]|nr:YciI family protein [Isosphaeraceae bacterium]